MGDLTSMPEPTEAEHTAFVSGSVFARTEKSLFVARRKWIQKLGEWPTPDEASAFTAGFYAWTDLEQVPLVAQGSVAHWRETYGWYE